MKNFSKFYEQLFEQKSYDFNSSQLDIGYFMATDKIFNYSLKMIPDSVLSSDDSRQMVDDIHITVLYGIHTHDFDEFKKVVRDSGVKNIKVKLGKISKFVKDEVSDVIYIAVEPDFNLTALRGFLKNNLVNTQTHENYTPHVTLAVVKSNSCDHLLGDDVFVGESIDFSQITFSDKNGNKKVYYFWNSLNPLNENATTVAPTSVATGQFQNRVGPVAFRKTLSEKVKDKLKGGEADGISDSNFDPKELKMGIAEEMEHTDDENLAKEIAKDHLIEDPKYYSRMKLYMESVDPARASIYAKAKQMMLTHQSHGIWKDPKGTSFLLDKNDFKKVDDSKTKEVADHFRQKGYSVTHHKDNVLVTKKGSHVGKDEVDEHLSKHFKDGKFKTSKIKTVDSNQKEFNSVMVKHLNG